VPRRFHRTREQAEARIQILAASRALWNRCARREGLFWLAAASAMLMLPTSVAGAEGRTFWYVYRDAGSPDNHGSWTNIIPASGRDMLRIDLADRSGPASGETAIRLDIAFDGGGWCGIVVAAAPGYWGDQPGDGYDLRRMRTLVFSARGAIGGERVRVKAAVAGDHAYGDSAPLPIDSGWFALTPEWRQYQVPTDGRDLARVITPFVLIANDKQNPSGRLSIFLDDIRFETAQ
jgi:hypothetical protein